MLKTYLSHFFRFFGVIWLFDLLNFYRQKIIFLKQNRKFLKEHPHVVLPPDRLIYETFGLNYKRFYDDSYDAARWIMNKLSTYTDFENKRVLDWGCGAGRITRHLPEILPQNSVIYGCDIDERAIQWCLANFKEIHFCHHFLLPRLPYESNFFDIVIGISIFTHLSEQYHKEWISEIDRILKPGGILYITTQGENFVSKLTKKELQLFKQGKLVVRSATAEGSRTFSAFQPVAFMKNLFQNFEILEHLVPKPAHAKSFPQDIWIVRKKL